MRTPALAKCVAVAAIFAAAGVAQTPPSADSLLAEAEAQAQATHLAVFVVFHASW